VTKVDFMKVDNTVDTERAWIQTFSGGKFHILDPRPEEILITDIGHSLSMMCRWTGHVRRFYSVAEHSVHASHLVPETDALWAILHDASEAYIADMNRPLKHYTGAGPAYRKVEEIVMNAICKKFDLPLTQPASVTEADNALLYAEKEQLMPPVTWDIKYGSEVAADVQLKCWNSDVAQVEFLHRFFELTNQL
jgi:hypothetical protein